MVAHSSILAWKIPWTEETGKLQRVRCDFAQHIAQCNNKKWRMRHQRLQKFQMPLTPKGLHVQVTLEGPGTLGTKHTSKATTRHLEMP